MENNKIWKASREAYVAYRKVKRDLRNIIKDHNASSRRLERAFKKFMETQAEAIYKLEDASQEKKLSKAYKHLQKTKREHSKSYETYSALLKEFRDTEVEYCVTVFKILRDQKGFILKEIAQIFGLWNATLSRWIQTSDDKDKLGKLYDKEFGELSRLETLNEDE